MSSELLRTSRDRYRPSSDFLAFLRPALSTVTGVLSVAPAATVSPDRVTTTTFRSGRRRAGAARTAPGKSIAASARPADTATQRSTTDGRGAGNDTCGSA